MFPANSRGGSNVGLPVSLDRSRPANVSLDRAQPPERAVTTAATADTGLRPVAVPQGRAVRRPLHAGEDDPLRLGEALVDVPSYLGAAYAPAQGRTLPISVNPAAVRDTSVQPFIAADLPTNVVYTGINLPGGPGAEGVYVGVDAGVMYFRSLTPGNNVIFTTSVDGDIIVNATGGTIQNEGSGTGLIFDSEIANVSYLRSLLADPAAANSGLTITTTGPNIVFANTLTASNLGAGNGLFTAKATPGILPFKSIIAGTNIVIAVTGTDLTINASGSISAGEFANEGTGTGLVFDDVIADIAYFRSLLVDPAAANSGLAIATVGQDIVIGTPLTAANLGGTYGLFTSKTGAGVLQFLGLTAGANVTLTASGAAVTIAVPGVAGAFVDGGNSFGAPAVLGTLDGNTLALIAGTAGQTAVTFSAAAAPAATFNYGVTVGGTGGASGTGSLTLVGHASGSVVFASSAAGALTIQTGAAPTTALTISTAQAVATANNTLDDGSGNMAVYGSLTLGNTLAPTAGKIVMGDSLGLHTFTQQAGAMTGSYAVTWPLTIGAAGQVLTYNALGQLTWASNPANAWQIGGNVLNSSPQVLGVTGTGSLTIYSANVAALVFSAGLATFIGAVAAPSSITASGGALVSGTIGSSAGSLVLNSGASTGSFTQTVGAITAGNAYSVAWPTSSPAAGTYVLTSSGGAAATLAWAAGGPGAFWAIGGNALNPSPQILGVTGTGSLTLYSANVAALTFTAGLATFIGAAAVPGALTLGGAATGTLNLNGSAGGTFTQLAPTSAITSYSVTWPATSPSAGTYVLTSSGGAAATLTWAAGGPGTFWAIGGNALNSSPQILGVTGTGSLTIYSANVAALTFTAGLATFIGAVAAPGALTLGGAATGTLNLNGSAGGTFTQLAPTSAITSYSVTWPATSPSAGTYVLSSSGGAAATLSWVDSSSGGNFWLVGGNVLNSSPQILGVTGTGSLTLYSANVAALTFTAGLATFVGAVTAPGALTLGANGGPTGTLSLNGSAGGTFTQLAPISAITSYSVTWPASSPGAGAYVLSSSGGAAATLSWVNSSSTGNFWLVGGNVLNSSPQILGVTGTGSLTLYSANVAALTFTAGLATFVGAVTAPGALTLGGAAAGTLNLNGSAGGTFTQLAPTSAITSYSVTWPATSPSAGTYVLTSTGGAAATLTWAAGGPGTFWAIGGNVLNSSPQILGVTGTGSLTIYSANVAALTFTAGLATFVGSITATGASVITAGSGTASGSLILTGSSSGSVSLTSTNLGAATLASTGALTVQTNGTTGLAISTAQAVTTANNILDSGGAVGNATIIGALTMGTAAAPGTLIMVGSTGNTFTQEVASVTSSYSVTWPATSPTAGTYVLTSTGGAAATLTWAATGASIYWEIGGNVLNSSPQVLGVTGTGSLTIYSANVAALAFSAGLATFVGAVTAPGNITSTAGALVSGTIGSSAGSLVLNSGSSTGAFTQTVGAITSGNAYSVAWPTSSPAAGSYVLSSSGGAAATLSWVNSGTGGNFWLVGGNTIASGAQALGVFSGGATLTVYSAAVAALTFTAALATFIGAVTAPGNITTTAGALVSGTIGSTAGSLVLNSAFPSGGSFTQTVGSIALANAYSVAWPTSSPAAGTYVLSSSGGAAATLSWATAASLSPWTIATDTNGGTQTANVRYNPLSSDMLLVGNTSTTESAGTFMMFNAGSPSGDTGSFRAGTVTGAQWTAINRGEYSAAFGYNNTASGEYSFCTGQGNTASGLGSAVLGGGTTNVASGLNSIVIGGNTSGASNTSSIVIGTDSTCSGQYAIATGYNANVTHNYSFVWSGNIGTGASMGAQTAAFYATLFWVENAITCGGNLTVGGNLIINAVAGGTLTQIASATAVNSYSITWPASSPAAGTYVLSSSGGAAATLSWVNSGTGGNFWLVGGNTIASGAQTLGVNSGGATLTVYSAAVAALTFTAALATFIGAVTAPGNITTTAGALITGTTTRSAAAWGGTGQLLQVDAATLSDTSSSGTVAVVVASSIASPTFATPTNAVTYTTAASLSVAAPVVGTNVAITRPYALWAAGGVRIDSQLTMNTTSVAGTSYTQLVTDFYLRCSNSAAVAITLITAPAAGCVLTVKDTLGAGRVGNPITITPASGTIDGAATAVINTAYESLGLIYDGTNWWTEWAFFGAAESPWILAADSVSGVADVRYNPIAANQLLVGNTTTAESNTGGTFLFFNSGLAIGDIGSFRAGTTTGNQWVAANRGAYSVAFGYNNTASGEYSFCAGSGNTTSGPGSFIGGGVGSTIGGTFTGNTICGGGDHSITGASGSTYNFIGGGYNNTHSTATSYNTIAGGQGNTTYVSEWSFIGGGSGNTSNGVHSSVVGGNSNTIAYFAGTGSYSFIGGGSGNNLYTGNLLNVASNYSAIVAGSGNSINTNVSTTTLNSSYSFIGAGASNNITAQYGVIGGGNTNNIHSTQGTGSIADDCFIGGGGSNNIYSGGATTGSSSQFSVICGGSSNTISAQTNGVLPAAYSFIGGGQSNTVLGEWATIPGGSGNYANGNYSFAAGQSATAGTVNSFVWGGTGSAVSDNGANTVTFGSSGFYATTGITSGVLGTTAGSLVLNSAMTGGGSVTQTVGSMLAAAGYTVTWPTSSPAAGTYVLESGGGASATLSWVTAASLSPWVIQTDQNGGSQINVHYNPLSTDMLLVGNTNTTESPGTFMMFNAGSPSNDTGSFRAGTVTGTQWTAINRGEYSAAFGYNCTASGEYGFACGNGSQASGSNSFAAAGATASGSGSAAFGGTALGTYNFAYSGGYAGGASYCVVGGSGCGSDSAFAVVSGGLSNNVNSQYGAIVGGKSNNILGPFQTIQAEYCFIGGGNGNNIYCGTAGSTLSFNCCIVGGSGNSINTALVGTAASSSNSFIGGGASNNITAQYSVIGGGNTNNITTTTGTGSLADDCFIGGGGSNFIYSGGPTTGSTSQWSVICGGSTNHINTNANGSLPAAYSFIGGGFTNTLTAQYGVIGGGNTNNILTAAGSSANADDCFIGGGASNYIYSGGAVTGTSSQYSVICGGIGNTVNTLTNGTTSVVDAFIGGGTTNHINAGSNHFIGGGSTNTMTGAGNSVITGGYMNTNGGQNCFMGGGYDNFCYGIDTTLVGGTANNILLPAGAASGNLNYSFLGGGSGNNIYAGDTTTSTASQYACIVGGGGNTINTASHLTTVISSYSVIGGGSSNTITAQYGTIPGGNSNTVSGANGFCCGNSANDGTIANRFVWADSTGFNTSTASLGLTGLTPGTDSVWWGCGTGTATGSPVFSIYTTLTRTGLGVSATLAQGSTAWAALCSRDAKENIVAVDPLDMLRRVDALGIYSFNYKGAPAGFTCRGPIADEWAALFPSAKDANRIETMDLDAAALGAIKGLSQLVRDQARRIEALEARLV